jgi:uncharacterized protein YndB with AHSA1/START domain
MFCERRLPSKQLKGCISTTDRIDKSALLRAPLQRVWHAISDASSFGAWFGMAVDGPFIEGATITAKITGTPVSEAVAQQQSMHSGADLSLHVVAVQPQHRFAFRWNALPEPEYAELTTLSSSPSPRYPTARC